MVGTIGGGGGSCTGTGCGAWATTGSGGGAMVGGGGASGAEVAVVSAIWATGIMAGGV